MEEENEINEMDTLMHCCKRHNEDWQPDLCTNIDCLKERLSTYVPKPNRYNDIFVEIKETAIRNKIYGELNGNPLTHPIESQIRTIWNKGILHGAFDIPNFILDYPMHVSFEFIEVDFNNWNQGAGEKNKVYEKSTIELRDDVIYFNIVHIARIGKYSGKCLKRLINSLLNPFYTEIMTQHYDFPPEKLQAFFREYMDNVDIGNICQYFFDYNTSVIDYTTIEDDAFLRLLMEQVQKERDEQQRRKKEREEKERTKTSEDLYENEEEDWHFYFMLPPIPDWYGRLESLSEQYIWSLLKGSTYRKYINQTEDVKTQIIENKNFLISLFEQNGLESFDIYSILKHLLTTIQNDLQKDFIGLFDVLFDEEHNHHIRF